MKFGAPRQGLLARHRPAQGGHPAARAAQPAQAARASAASSWWATGTSTWRRARRRSRPASSCPSGSRSAGVEIQNSVTLRATPDRAEGRRRRVGPIKREHGRARRRAVPDRPSRRATDDVAGPGEGLHHQGLCLDMVPPNGQVKIRTGAELRRAPASVPAARASRCSPGSTWSGSGSASGSTRPASPATRGWCRQAGSSTGGSCWRSRRSEAVLPAPRRGGQRLPGQALHLPLHRAHLGVSRQRGGCGSG